MSFKTLHPDHVLLTVKPPLKTFKTRPQWKEKNNRKIRKERPKIIHKISLITLSLLRPSASFEMRKLATNLKRLKSLSCLEIDLSSILADSKVMLRFFESLKHFKNHSKIHFFYSESMQALRGNNRLLVSIGQAISHIRHFPQEEIKFSLLISRGSCLQDSTFCKMLESFASHVTHLELTFPSMRNESAMKKIISIFKDGQFLSQVSLTIDGCLFWERVYLQSYFPQDFKELKSLKSLNVYFKNGQVSLLKFEELAFILKEALQVPILKVIYEEKQSSITRLEWWLFTRVFKNHKYIQNFQAKSIGKFRILTCRIASFLCPIFSIMFLAIALIFAFNLFKI